LYSGHRTDVYNLLDDEEIQDLRAYVSKPVLSKVSTTKTSIGRTSLSQNGHLKHENVYNDDDNDELLMILFLKIDHGHDLQWLSEMRQVSVLFINMVLPKRGDLSSWALQKAFEIIHQNVKNLGGKF